MAWYSTGSVSLTNGAAAVSGASTLWVDNGTLYPGDVLYAPDGELYQVLSIASNTALTLATPYAGTTVTGANYAIIPIGMLPSALALQVKTTLAAANAVIASASSATTSAATATTQAGVATTQAGIATTQAGNAATSATSAATQATNAAASATAAAGSATTATTQAGIATTQAGNASTQATAAAGSATAAAGSATTAATNAASVGFTASSTTTFTHKTILASGSNTVDATSLNGATFAAPGAIGGTTAGAGSFTSLTASGTVGGTGFSNYLAAPPAIGGTTPAAGSFTALQATSLNGGPFGGFRNKLINGDMRVAQRGNVAMVNGSILYGGADRWLTAIYGFTTASATAQQVQGSGTSSGYWQYIGALTTTGSGTGGVFQRIESKSGQDLNGQYITVSAIVYQDTGSTLTLTAQLQKATVIDNFGSTTNIGAGQTYSVPTATITKIVYTVLLGGSDAANGLQIGLTFAVGAVTGKNLLFGDIQLERGTVATPFETRPIGMELALCQRYFEKSYPQGISPGGIGTPGFVENYISAGIGSFQAPGFKFSVTKRGNPTIKGYSQATGAVGYGAGVITGDKVISFEGGCDSGTNVYFTGTGSDLYRFHWTADAEL